MGTPLVSAVAAGQEPRFIRKPPFLRWLWSYYISGVRARQSDCQHGITEHRVVDRLGNFETAIRFAIPFVNGNLTFTSTVT